MPRRAKAGKREPKARGRKKRPGKRAASRRLSIRIGRKAGNGAGARAERELRDFERAHRKAGSPRARAREQDEHVDFEHMKRDIERHIGRGGGRPSEGRGGGRHIAREIQPSRMELVQSGIEGLDDILGGGLPKSSFILLSGTCGTGKSIFGMDFLIKGAQMGEPGIYISLEESPGSSIQQMKLLGWPVDGLIRKGKLLILQPELYNFDALLTTIEDSVNRIKARRLVIDSISIIGMYFADAYKVRKSLLQLGSLLKKLNCTTLAIDEIKEGEPSLSAYGVEEFVADGVIVLYLIKRGNIYVRAALVRKMRGMDHSTKIHPMEIRPPKGLVIYPSQELFEEPD